MNEKDLELKKKENDNLQEIFYKGAPKKGQLQLKNEKKKIKTKLNFISFR